MREIMNDKHLLLLNNTCCFYLVYVIEIEDEGSQSDVPKDINYTFLHSKLTQTYWF